MIAIIKCGWCGVYIRTDQWPGKSKKEVVSHGICGQCLAAQTEALAERRAVENNTNKKEK